MRLCLSIKNLYAPKKATSLTMFSSLAAVLDRVTHHLGMSTWEEHSQLILVRTQIETRLVFGKCSVYRPHLKMTCCCFVRNWPMVFNPCETKHLLDIKHIHVLGQTRNSQATMSQWKANSRQRTFSWFMQV